MPDVPLNFSRAEYAGRIARTRAAMDAAGIDVLFCTDPSNMAWLTGYDGWSFYVHQGVLLGPTGDPMFWGRRMDAAGAMRTCWIGADDIHGYADDYVMSDVRHAMQHLALLIREKGWGALRLGVEMENYYYSARAHQVLDGALAMGGHSEGIADATGLVNRRRAVKSPTEILYMRRAARIVERMHAAILEHVAPGRRRNEVAAEIFKAGIWGAEDDEGVPYGGDYPAIVPLMPMGRDASAAHLTWDDRPFEAGTATFFEITRRCAGPCFWASRPKTCASLRTRCWRGSTPASPPRSPATPRATWRPPSTACWRGAASRARGAAAIRSG
jgi:ectoine hydrolase